MLKHEENPETPSQSAAQKRVTSAALASAIARLEAKQEGKADGTIAIGEAVSELGLAATPEAVWAEVEAVRARRTTAKNRRVSHRQRLALVSCLGLGLIGVIGWWSIPHRTEEDQAATAMALNLSPPQAAPKPISLNPNLLVGDASGKLFMLSEVGDNQPVRCSYGGGSFHPCSADGVPWTLIKHDSNIYVRGKIVAMSAKVMQTDGALVGCDASLPPYAVRVTLPVKRFEVDTDAGLNDRFHAVNIHLDKYAYEKWQP